MALSRGGVVKFLNGHTKIVDEPCRGWPSVINEINIVWALIEENGCITVAEIEWYFQNGAYDLLLHGSHQNYTKVRLGMRKIFAGWVPKLLDDEQKLNIVAVGLDFMCYYDAKGGGSCSTG